ncbi:MAG: class I SAM-dependent methyltransferase [Trueperaceae bacterium]|nr:class I SAM-dependent methyltransferase [Trueperaceae bacterium]
MFHVKQPPEPKASSVGDEGWAERGVGEGSPALGVGDSGAAASDIAARAAIDAYRALLERYRGTLDLMSPRAFDELDAKVAEAERYAAVVARFAPETGAVLDLGTGAGLPGAVVAARLAPRPVWWVERRHRRATFLAQVAARAGFEAVRVADRDVRDLDAVAVGPVVAVTAQAVASFEAVASLTRHLWDERVLLVSRKGPGWEAEVEALRQAVAGWGTATVEVVATEPLGTRGTLIAVRVQGGPACPPSA